MAEDKNSEELISVRASVVSEFLGSLWGKILAILTAITLLLGIYVEAISAWRGTNEAIIASSNVRITESNVVKAREDAAAAHAQSCSVRLANVLGSRDASNILNSDDPDALAILEDCKEFVNKDIIEDHRRSIKEEQERKQRLYKEDNRPRNYDECVDVVAFRYMMTEQSPTNSKDRTERNREASEAHQAAQQQVRAKGPDDLEVVECMKLSRVQANAIKPTTINQCRDWALAQFAKTDPEEMPWERAAELGRFEASLAAQGKAEQDKYSYLERCMSGRIDD